MNNIADDFHAAYEQGYKDRDNEIVRCKECEYWERKGEGFLCGYCHAAKHGHYSSRWEIHIIRTTEESFFCKDGVREVNDE